MSRFHVLSQTLYHAKQCAAQCRGLAQVHDRAVERSHLLYTDLCLLSSSPAFIGSLPPSKTMTGVTPAALMTSTLPMQ